MGALSAMAMLANELKEDGEYDHSYWKNLYIKACIAYRERLWNGSFFRYDSSVNEHCDSIMADQLAGQWYTRACGIDPVVDGDEARIALSTVFSCNVQIFGQYRFIGAVNGMRPNGVVDNACLQVGCC